MSNQTKQLAKSPGRPQKAPVRTVPHRSLPVAMFSNQDLLLRTPADRVQAQLEVGQPDDVYEREAERIADAVVGERATSLPTPDLRSIRRAPVTDEKKKKKEPAAPTRPTVAAPAPKPPAPKPAPPPPAPPTRVETAKPAEPRAPAGKAAPKPAPAVETKGPPTKKKAETPPVTTTPDVKEESSRKKDEEQTLAAKALPGTVPAVTPAVSAGIHTQQGAGRPLGQSERSFYEGRMNRDLSHVRVHDDAHAAATARELSAHAFTYGQDIFFGAGRHQPHTSEGRRLLAHELVHTMQQRPSGVARRIQRQAGGQPGGAGAGGGATTGGAGATPAAPSPADATTFDEKEGRLDLSDAADPKVVFSSIELPGFKYEGDRKTHYDQHMPLRQAKNYERGNPQQREFWRTNLDTKTIKDRLTQIHNEKTSGGGEGYLFAAPKDAKDPSYFTGNLDTIATMLLTPTWDESGAYTRFDVDHIVELQLANWPDPSSETWANKLENMWLLDQKSNRSSGSVIAQTINQKADAFSKKAAGDQRIPRGAASVRERYPLVFRGATAGKSEPPTFWERKNIEGGKQLDQVRVAHQSELGMPGALKVFPAAPGGQSKRFTWPPAEVTDEERGWLGGFVVTNKSFKAGPESVSDPNFGTLSINVNTAKTNFQKFPSDVVVPVNRMSTAPYAGYIEKSSLLAQLRSQRIRVQGASPLELDELDIIPGVGLYITGKVMPDVPVLKGGIDFELAGAVLSASKEFSSGEIEVPKPFSISNVDLVLKLMTAAPYVEATGEIDFGIERVGQGFVKAQGSPQGLEFDGEFNFDTKLFNPAKLHVGYHNSSWEGSGELGIPPGKVPGIRRANIKAGYTQGTLSAQGTADLAIPGVQQGAMSLKYSEAEGLSIGGSFTLASNIPGIRGGGVEALVQERPDGEGYAVHAKGTAQPAIPGIDTQLTVTYDDSAFTIEGQAAYARGMMSGSISLGATNRPISKEGNPIADAAPTERLTAYGSGTLTVRLTPWLQGTVGVRILGNGELELAGAIALPSELQIFPEKSYSRNIFSINIDIPIVGVSVAGVRIGIFATIGGGLELTAGVGPGVLRDVGVSITYNPSHEDQTHVVGAAHLHIPAHAGLRLFVHGGIGAGLVLVSATAGLEIGGQLGLEAAADAGVQIDWMPNRGLILDASASVSIEPKFKFDVTGYVTVDAGAFGFTYNLYEKRWQLAAVEYGSGLRLGMTLPIHYQEGQPFDVSWNDVKFDIPQVNATDVLKGLIAQIA